VEAFLFLDIYAGFKLEIHNLVTAVAAVADPVIDARGRDVMAGTVGAVEDGIAGVGGGFVTAVLAVAVVVIHSIIIYPLSSFQALKLSIGIRSKEFLF